ncbi:MAG: hypothetical protein AB8B71_13505 [Paracoccaceae bacterium]
MISKRNLDLTPQEIEVIEAALNTQEKILSVQSRAGRNAVAASRLSQLQSVLRNVRRQSPARTPATGFGYVARYLFG